MEDEWDEFLSRASEDFVMTSSSVSVKNEEKVADSSIQVNTINGDLGDFGDNAEVLMQMARGESLSQLSSNGVWINSTSNIQNQNNSATSSNTHQAMKRSLKTSSPSVPIANSFQDLTRALTGHPLLSHPLALLSQKRAAIKEHLVPLYEIDSLGLFFYGSCGDGVKVDSNVKDDFMKVIEMKRLLLEKSILNNVEASNEDYSTESVHPSDAQIIVSFENLKILSNSIPPNGKSSWLIPFEVTSTGSVDLSFEAFSPMNSQINLFYDYARSSVESQLAASQGLLEDSEHFIIIDNLKVRVKTKNPAYNIVTNFRGSSHPDPSTEPLNFLFYRQSNYSIEIDFETLKIASIKSFVPKFDQQNRLFLLLKGLKSKLLDGKLTEGRYYLAHTANCPFIKILSINRIEGKEPFIFK